MVYWCVLLKWWWPDAMEHYSVYDGEVLDVLYRLGELLKKADHKKHTSDKTKIASDPPATSSR